jgi:hypothetical protein
MTQQRREVSVRRRSLLDEAWREAEAHKWIESQKRGLDLGEWAVRDWYERYWGEFCRHRLMEHLAGKEFWVEFTERKFGLLQQFPLAQELIYQTIIDYMYSGMENLLIINLSLESDLPLSTVRQILGQIDMNDERLTPPLA